MDYWILDVNTKDPVFSVYSSASVVLDASVQLFNCEAVKTYVYLTSGCRLSPSFPLCSPETVALAGHSPSHAREDSV